MEMFEYLNELQVAGEKLIHSYGVLVMITLFLSWVASFAAILLMILDRTKWKLYSDDMLPQLLASYLFSSLPHVIYQFLRTEVGKWIALLTVVLRLFLPNHFPESLEIPGATILLIVTTPNDIVAMFRDDWRDIKSVCFITSCLLIILDRTKWKSSTNMLTSLLAPYLFNSLPQVIFQFLRTGFGKWIALLTVVLRLFLPNRFPESLEIPGATILFIVVTPNALVEGFRGDLRFAILCLCTSSYLLSKHTKSCGGYKNSFTQKDKITYTICLYLLYVYPIWSSFAYLFY